MVKYFAICAPWALSKFGEAVMDGSVPESDCGGESRTKRRAFVWISDSVRPECYPRQSPTEDDRSPY
jgi:hypothetical protein